MAEESVEIFSSHITLPTFSLLSLFLIASSEPDKNLYFIYDRGISQWKLISYGMIIESTGTNLYYYRKR